VLAERVGDTYGAAGAVVIILVWVYYSAVILIYGAHYTHVNTREHGSGVRPSPHATAIDHPATPGDPVRQD